MKTTDIKWDKDAEERLKQAPFFIRKLAKSRVEKAAIKLGKDRVTLEFFLQIKNQEMPS